MFKINKLKAMLFFTIGYLIIFTVTAIINRNYEFLYYTIIMSILIAITILYHKKFHLSTGVIAGLTLVGAMHIFGGNIYIGNTRLYDIWIIDGIVKYDFIVHFIGIFVATLIAYSLLHPYLDKRLRYNNLLLPLLLVLIALGMGALNEIAELVAVVFFGAAEKVGNYMNNALDLMFNLLGSITACFYLIYYHNKKKK